MKKRTLAVVACLLLAASATAAEKVDLSGPAPADGLVIIENIVGSIEVVGWDKDEVAVTGTLGEDVEDLEFETGSTSRIEVVFPRDGHDLDDGADLVVKVPRGCKLEVEVVAAPVDVRGVERRVEVGSVSGDVRIHDACEDLEVTAVSGKITIDAVGARTSVNAVSGDIEVRGGETELTAETVTSAIDVRCDLLRDATFSTVSGSIEVTAGLARRASLEAEAVNGSVTLNLPADVDAEFEITTFNGSIDSDFGGKVRRTSRYAPGSELEFTAGEGSADVSVNTLNGKVSLRRQ